MGADESEDGDLQAGLVRLAKSYFYADSYTMRYSGQYVEFGLCGIRWLSCFTGSCILTLAFTAITALSIPASPDAPVHNFVYVLGCNIALAPFVLPAWRQWTPIGNVLRFDHGIADPVIIPGMFWDYVTANLAVPESSVGSRWHTQLSFTTSDEDQVLAVLSRAFSLAGFSGWEHRDTSPANVVTHVNECTSPNGPAEVSRQTYRGWTTPIYYFDRRVALDDILSLKSTFRYFDELDLGFKLIDYGILELEDESDGR